MTKQIIISLIYISLFSATTHGVQSQAELTLDGFVSESSGIEIQEAITDFEDPGLVVGEEYLVATILVYSNALNGWELTIDSGYDGYMKLTENSSSSDEVLPYQFKVTDFSGTPPSVVTSFTVNGSFPNPSNLYSDVIVIRMNTQSPTNGWGPQLSIRFPESRLLRPGEYSDTIQVVISSLN